MFISIYGVFQKRFVDLSTCRICRMSLLLRLRYITPTGGIVGATEIMLAVLRTSAVPVPLKSQPYKSLFLPSFSILLQR